MSWAQFGCWVCAALAFVAVGFNLSEKEEKFAGFWAIIAVFVSVCGFSGCSPRKLSPRMTEVGSRLYVDDEGDVRCFEKVGGDYKPCQLCQANDRPALQGLSRGCR